jgi:hypothetical protein
MTDIVASRPLAALIALSDKDDPLEVYGDGAKLPPSLTLDERADIYLRAMHSSGRDFTERERSVARIRLLDVMADDLADEPDLSDEGFSLVSGATPGAASPPIKSPSRHRFRSLLREMLIASLTSPFVGAMRFVTAALATVLFAGAAWTGAWFYTARSAEIAVASWIGSESKTKAAYACGSRMLGGFPFRVEIHCDDLKISVTSNQLTYVIDVKELHATASILRPTVVVADITGPLSLSETGKPALFIGNWALARATLRGSSGSPEGVALALEGFQFYHATQVSMVPLLTGDRLELDLKSGLAASVEKHDYDIAVRIEGGSVPAIGMVASEPFAVEAAAILHGASAGATAELSAWLRAWQAGGGRLELASARVQQRDAVATAAGIVGLSVTGHVDGNFRVVTSGDYVQVAQSLMRAPAASQSSFSGLQSRALTPNVPVQAQENSAQVRPAPPAPASLNVPIRLDDGIVYLGATLVGKIPPLF